MKLRLVVFTSITLFSCGKETKSQLKANVGNGHMRPWMGQDLPPIEGGIGLMDGLCTVFHLGDGIVATAGHCISAQIEAEQPCLAHQISWQDGTESQCVQVLEHSYSEESDFAIIEVDPAPSSSFEVSQTQPDVGEELIILGYPKDSDLHISDQCRFYDESQTSFKHNCDTLPGYSGGPILKADDLTILGIHNGNRDPQFNYGTKSSQIRSTSDWQGVRARRYQQTEWGPFPDNENKLLYHFKSENEMVSFDLDYDTEDGYDFVFVLDGDGVKYTLTGQGTKQFNLKAPVVVTFESDYAGQSNHVSLAFNDSE